MATDNSDNVKQSYDLRWSFEPRVATEHLGSRKYQTSTKAIRELVANSLQAGSRETHVTLHENEIGGVDYVEISDKGRGISSQDLRERFMLIGVVPEGLQGTEAQLGRFGIGRLAVYRIGSYSEWTSVSGGDGDDRIRISFTLKEEEQDSPLRVTEEKVSKRIPLGTRIRIYNLRDKDNSYLSETPIAKDLLGHFCSYLLANPTKRILVQGTALNVEAIVESREEETLSSAEWGAANTVDAKLTHLILTKPVEGSSLPDQLIFSAKGRTVATEHLDNPPLPQYLCITECPALEEVLTSSREGLVEMDETFAKLRKAVVQRIDTFGTKVKDRKKRSFIQRARQERYYPFPTVSVNAIMEMERALYDVTLERVHERANLDGMTGRQRELVFKLLKRVIENNEDLLSVLEEVAAISDDDATRFRAVLERTTLDQIIKLSSIVTIRLDFLDLLHELVYGETAKHLRERSQLHRVLEPHCWLFGVQYDMATSDQAFRTVLQRHREKAGCPQITEEVIAAINGIDDIPDLFLASARDYPSDAKRHHHLLVELKAPRVSLGKNERDQIRRYADTILESHEFDKTTTRWNLYLVSAKVTEEIERDRNQSGKPHGVLWDWDEMTVWAFEWNELITRAKDEMKLVRDNLERKARQLSVSETLRNEFPDILDSLVRNANDGSDAVEQGDETP